MYCKWRTDRLGGSWSAVLARSECFWYFKRLGQISMCTRSLSVPTCTQWCNCADWLSVLFRRLQHRPPSVSRESRVLPKSTESFCGSDRCIQKLSCPRPPNFAWHRTNIKHRKPQGMTKHSVPTPLLHTPGPVRTKLKANSILNYQEKRRCFPFPPRHPSRSIRSLSSFSPAETFDDKKKTYPIVMLLRRAGCTYSQAILQ